MAKKVADKVSREVQDYLAQKRLVIGTDRTLQGLRRNKLDRVFLSQNAPAEVKQDIQYYAGLTSTAVDQLTKTNEELGVVCKKPFSISVLGVLRE